jgi:hypothetical protein
MARFTLSIETNDDNEFATFAQRLAGLQTVVSAAVETVVVAAEKPTKQTRAKAEKPADDVAAAQNGGDPAAPGSPKQVVAETPAPTPAPEPEPVVQTPVVETATPSAGPVGEVTLDMLKDELNALLKKPGVGAKAAQDLIREHGNGAAGLSQLAGTDYAAVHAALVAANAA